MRKPRTSYEEFQRDDLLFAHDLKSLEVKKWCQAHGINADELDLHEIEKIVTEISKGTQIKRTGKLPG
jgi:hypothetical protein